MANIEQKIQAFHSQLRTDYLSKVQEVANLHNELAKLQARLLDTEHENHILKLQLSISKSQGMCKEQQVEPQHMTAAPPLTGSIVECTSSNNVVEELSQQVPKSPSKRARSPSLEIIESIEPSPKKSKVEVKVEDPSSTLVITPQTSHAEASTSNERIYVVGSASPTPNEVSAAEISTTGRSSPVLIPDSKKFKLKLKHKKPEDSEAFSIPKTIVEKYLQKAETFNITPPPLEFGVSRPFLGATYGGSFLRFMQSMKVDRNPSGAFIREAIFPQSHLNPHLPSQPGQPGFIISSRSEVLSHSRLSLFCKDNGGWWYRGEYKGERVGSMTGELFGSQPTAVKRNWAKRLLTQKQNSVYHLIRARVALRLSVTIPIEDKEEEARIIEEEVKAIKRKQGTLVSEDDIVNAFSNGDEQIDIILMMCVDYDHTFANDMKTRSTNPPSSQSKIEMADLGGDIHTKVSISNEASTSSNPDNQCSALNDLPRQANIASRADIEGYTRPQRLRKQSRKLMESMTEHLDSSTRTHEEWSRH
ncbi:hypothetical protein BDN70DRAFT_876706 [Pholiota conissans]|uniref:DUF6697 domain-containing protein n=1 Tax=Pholiota conissans TaxID=109636 RepID=A0A9P6D261_9AGAR|nr:hypothetical protein BDN70DRAFT_876706 [Pholiota conissans]